MLNYQRVHASFPWTFQTIKPHESPKPRFTMIHPEKMVHKRPKKWNLVVLYNISWLTSHNFWSMEYLWQTRDIPVPTLRVTIMLGQCIRHQQIDQRKIELRTKHSCETLWNSDIFTSSYRFSHPFPPDFFSKISPFPESIWALDLEQKMWWQFSQRSNSLLVSSWQIQHLRAIRRRRSGGLGHG